MEALTVQDCNVAGFTAGRGLVMWGNTQLAVLRSVFRDNQSGAYLEAGVRGRIVDSQFLSVSGTVLSNNTQGMLVEGASAQALLHASTVSHNLIGLQRLSGTLTSTGTNAVLGNVGNTSGAITSAAPM